MQADAISAVQELTGRHVVAFMSTNHIEPDLAVEVFVLEHLNRQATEKADAAHGHNGRLPLTRPGRDPVANGRVADELPIKSRQVERSPLVLTV